MGGPVGLPIWIDAVQQEERRKKLGLDALVACYLILRGPDGLDLVENRFLKNPHAEYTHIYSTIMALRFHGDENTGVVPRERLLEAMRLLLDNPDFADQVILDLSRWEDWSVLDRLVEMFKTLGCEGLCSATGGELSDRGERAAGRRGDAGESGGGGAGEARSGNGENGPQLDGVWGVGAGAGCGVGGERGSTLTRALSKGRGALQRVRTECSRKAGVGDGFEARVCGVGDDDKADPKQIPDPAGYEQNEGQGRGKGCVGGAGSATRPLKQPRRWRGRQVVVSKMNPVVVAGVPLLAAGLLMGVYWLILRAGAV